MHQYERFMIRGYAKHAINSTRRLRFGTRQRPSGAVAVWLYDNADWLGCPGPDQSIIEELSSETSKHFSIKPSTWKSFSATLRELQVDQKPPSPSGIEKRLSWLSKLLGLPPTDADLLGLSARVVLWRDLQQLVNAVDDVCDDHVSLTGLAALTGLSHRQVRGKLLPGSPLLLYGLLESDGGNGWTPSETVLRIVREQTVRPKGLHSLLMGKARPAKLGWNDFDHLGPDRDLAERLVGAALASRQPGVNLLLYGASGTGKTEFARTLARRLKASAIFVGETDDDGTEPHRSSRITAFAILRRIATAGSAILVMDEADDVFTGVDEDDWKSRVGSKVFMNRLVEQTQPPTIWITNYPERLGSAVIRRMSLAIRFPEPSRAVRRRLLKRVADRRSLELSPSAIDALAQIRGAPAVLENALAVAKLTGGGEQDASLTARSILKAMHGQPQPALSNELSFDPALSAADQDLTILTRQIVNSRGSGASFCFYGLPGTGKSAYARHLAERLRLDVLEKRASDLFSMWVGGTEKAIAEAFQEAADLRAMLILDEADSLLRNRAGARASWEVSQVNEMLAAMERHPYPFVCTTNLMESLDPATLRRFVFKVQFLPMRPAQSRVAFFRLFGQQPPPIIETIEPLVPADFAVVAKKLRVLGGSSPEAIAEMLAAEVAAKPRASLGRKIGFG